MQTRYSVDLLQTCSAEQSQSDNLLGLLVSIDLEGDGTAKKKKKKSGGGGGTF